MYKTLTFILIFCLVYLVAACGGDNQPISVSTTLEECPDGASAPYCMSVTIGNNIGGQNYINSSNFAINNISVSVSGADNILTPGNSAAMDPNHCTNNQSLKPGSACTFYLQITNESYAVGDIESVNVNIQYQSQDNSLNNENNSTYLTTFTVHEITNLYITQNNQGGLGSLYVFNNSGLTNYGQILNDSILSTTIDNNVYGILYLGGTQGIYGLGYAYQTSQIIPAAAAITGANNVIFMADNLYATANNILGSGIWQYNIAADIFNASPSYSLMLIPNNNIITYSPFGVIYLSSGNQIYYCSLGTCQVEGSVLDSSLTINSIAFLPSTFSSATGLFVGTDQGVYYESGILGTSVATWSVVTNTEGVNITDMIIDNIGNLYVAATNGQIYKINQSTPTIANTLLSPVALDSVTAMAFDMLANKLYFTAGNNLYVYSLSDSSYNLVGSIGNSNVIGLNIGSRLVN